MSYSQRPLPFIKRYRAILFKLGLIVTLVLIIAAFKLPIYSTIHFNDMDDSYCVFLDPPDHKNAEIEDSSMIVYVESSGRLGLPTIPKDIGSGHIELPHDKGLDEIFTNPEVMPLFPGGEKCLLEYLGQIPYCQMAKDAAIEGKLYVLWLVGKDGHVKDVEIKRGLYKCINEDVVDHIQKMPNWVPGRQGGVNVSTQLIAPINFSLD